MGLTERAIRFYRANGVLALPRKTLTYLHKNILKSRRPHPIAKRRLELSRRLFTQSGGTVLEGPLKGFHLNPSSISGGRSIDQRWLLLLPKAAN